MTTSRVPLHRNKWLHLALGLAVSIACLWWAAADLLRDPADRARMGDAFTRADYRTLPPILLALACFFLLKAWRWRLLLRPVGDFHTLRALFPPMMIGFAVNNLLPAHAGDLFRVFVFARRARATYTSVLSTVVLERVFDVIAVLIILGGGLAFVPGLDPAVRRTAWVFAGAAAAFVAAALVYVFWTRPFVVLVERLLALIPFLPAGLRSKLTGMLEAGASGLSALKHPQLLLGILGASLGQWLLNAATVHLSLWSFGVHVSPLVACIVLGVTALGVAVPSSPGYFGVIQVCFMTVLKLFVPPEGEVDVFAASVYYHLSSYVPVTLVGLYFFNATGLRLAEAEAQAEAAAEGAGTPSAAEATSASLGD